MHQLLENQSLSTSDDEIEQRRATTPALSLTDWLNQLGGWSSCRGFAHVHPSVRRIHMLHTSHTGVPSEALLSTAFSLGKASHLPDAHCNVVMDATDADRVYRVKMLEISNKVSRRGMCLL